MSHIFRGKFITLVSEQSASAVTPGLCQLLGEFSHADLSRSGLRRVAEHLFDAETADLTSI